MHKSIDASGKLMGPSSKMPTEIAYQKRSPYKIGSAAFEVLNFNGELLLPRMLSS